MRDQMFKTVLAALVVGAFAFGGQAVAQDMETEAVDQDLRPDEYGSQAAGDPPAPPAAPQATSPADDDSDEQRAIEEGLAPGN